MKKTLVALSIALSTALPATSAIAESQYQVLPMDKKIDAVKQSLADSTPAGQISVKHCGLFGENGEPLRWDCQETTQSIPAKDGEALSEQSAVAPLWHCDDATCESASMFGERQLSFSLRVTAEHFSLDTVMDNPAPSEAANGQQVALSRGYTLTLNNDIPSPGDALFQRTESSFVVVYAGK